MNISLFQADYNVFTINLFQVFWLLLHWGTPLFSPFTCFVYLSKTIHLWSRNRRLLPYVEPFKGLRVNGKSWVFIAACFHNFVNRGFKACLRHSSWVYLRIGVWLEIMQYLPSDVGYLSPNLVFGQNNKLCVHMVHEISIGMYHDMREVLTFNTF